jgi:hypothetical protein
VHLYITQKICLGHSDGKTFECAKFLKHSLQQGYIAGLGQDVGKALVKDTPRWQMLQRTSYEHTIPTAFKLIRGRGWPGIISEMEQLPYGETGAVRINDWRVSADGMIGPVRAQRSRLAKETRDIFIR